MIDRTGIMVFVRSGIKNSHVVIDRAGIMVFVRSGVKNSSML